MKKTVLILFLFTSYLYTWSQDDDSVSTYPTITANNGQSGIGFEISCNTPIKLVGVKNTFNTGSSFASVWIRNGGIGSPPSITTSAGWVEQDSASVTGNNTSPVLLPITLNYRMAKNTAYGFFIDCKSGGTRYHTHSTTDPSSYTDGVLTIEVGSKGYGGARPSPTFNPRDFVGVLLYRLLPYGMNNAGATAVVEPEIACEGPRDIKATIQNFGQNQINSVQVHWSVNGNPQSTINYTQVLDTFYGSGQNIDTVILGTHTFTSAKTDTIVVWTALPNNVADTVTENDTTTEMLPGIANPALSLGLDTNICKGSQIQLDAGAGRDSIFWSTSSTNRFINADSGLYTVVVYENGCMSADTLNIGWVDSASVSITVDPNDTICYGEELVFRAFPKTLGEIIYQWKVNAANIGTQTAVDTLSPSLSNGDVVSIDLITDQCSSTSYTVPSNDIAMSINPEPQLINGITGLETVLEFTSKAYSINPGINSTVLWKVFGGSITGDSTLATVQISWGAANSSASLSCTETDANSCAYESVLDVFVKSVVGLDEIEGLIVGHAFPNPTDKGFRLPVHSNGVSRVQIRVFDLTGKEVLSIFQGEVKGNQLLDISTADLKDGIYFCKITSSNSFDMVEKIIVRH